MPMPAKLPRYQEGGLVSGPGTDYSALWRRQAEANNRKWDAVNQENAPTRQPMHRIAPPQMSANAQNVMAGIMGRSTPNAGAALSKIANVWATKHAADQEAQAKQQYDTERNRKRADWIGALSEGASPEFLAYTDPSFIDD